MRASSRDPAERTTGTLRPTSKEEPSAGLVIHPLEDPTRDAKMAIFMKMALIEIK
jgi:hypothetical protein